MLVEFALIAFVFWLLLAGVLELGRALSAQQILQHVSRTIAREVSQQALPHDASFDQAVAGVLDVRFLVIDSTLLSRCGFADFGETGHDADLDRLFRERLPVGNRLLRPLMIRDRVGSLEMLRYPGAVLRRTDGLVGATSGCEAGSLYTVGIPHIDASGERIEWFKVVEAEPGPDASGTNRTGFALRDGGWAGVRLHYPFQSAAMPGARDAGVTSPTTGRDLQTLTESDQAYTDLGLERLEAELLVGPDSESRVSAYAGSRGLGRLLVGRDASGDARAIRPWRRLLTASAGFRREVFLPSAGAS